MGTLYYGDARRAFDIDDRTLMHVRVVALAKLRRAEPFPLNLERTVKEGSGRTTIWVHPAIPLEFEFAGSRSAAINRDWLELLNQTAASGNGMTIVDEPVTRLVQVESQAAV